MSISNDEKDETTLFSWDVLAENMSGLCVMREIFLH